MTLLAVKAEAARAAHEADRVLMAVKAEAALASEQAGREADRALAAYKAETMVEIAILRERIRGLQSAYRRNGRRHVSG